ncbi:MAG: TIGR03089 family protein [Actinomycetota bacterium]|nr:TIGR03089 family protein [Actinomycetota bacterium]
MRQLIISELFARALARDPAGPLLTYYDDAGDERTELSATTLGNWVAKTANLLTDGLRLDTGARLAVILPPHWQSAGILLGAWAAGHLVVDYPDVDAPVQPDAVFCTEADLESYANLDCEVVGLTLDPWGRGLAPQWRRVTDYAQEIGIYGDQFRPSVPIAATAPALTAGSLELTQAGVADAAQEMADRLGMTSGGRILVSRDLAISAGPVSWLLAPLAAGSSIVLVTDPGSPRIAARAQSEQVTATLGIELTGVPVLGG